ncbi:VCBS repeat-containing protein [Actinomadura sp. NPDC047616]|uniref:FG-GAP repeat domain-containing protein n=1 Tax=Actinomadura sp. NPDC047616 TaxID=3155914 RepID=UPI0033F90CCB
MIARSRARLVQICSVILLLVAWQVATLPDASQAELRRLAARFAFERVPLNDAVVPREVRAVAPAYRHIRHWISSVGAAVALADVDGNGRPDEFCVVDPRDDSVTLAPVPHTGARFPATLLTPAGALPYDATMAPMGCTPGDYNEDGRPDVMVHYWGRSPVLFLRTPAPLGTARAFAPRELVTPYQVWNTNAVTLADVDGDGHTDIVVGNYFPDRARVLDTAARQSELVMQRSMSAAYNGGVNRILLWRSGAGGEQPDASFGAVPQPFPDRVAKGWTLATGAQDLDGDGRPELYFANDFGPDRLLRNQSEPGRVRLRLVEGTRHLTTPKSKVLGKDSFKGMGVAFTDLNTDGVPDMVVSNITEQYGLLESNFAWLSTRRDVLRGGTAHYDDHSESLGLSRSGWGWDVKTGDFAGTGTDQILQATGFVRGRVNRWPELQELAMTNDDLLARPGAWPRFAPGRDDVSGDDPNPFFVRGADGRFHDLARRLGVADPGVSRGLALADVDRDGRLDFAVANQWRQSQFYRNTRAARPPYLGLRLLRPAGTCQDASRGSAGVALTPAIGAAARVDAGGRGVRVRQAYPANGHAGVSSPDLLFGLPAGTTARTAAAPVTVSWRDACGVLRTGRIRLAPGWHDLVLASDGSIREKAS